MCVCVCVCVCVYVWCGVVWWGRAGSLTHSIRSNTLIHNSSAVALYGAIFIVQNRLAVLCLIFNSLHSRKKMSCTICAFKIAIWTL